MPHVHPSLLRRLAAIFYDALLLFSVLFFASFPLLFLTGGQAIEHNPLYTLYLFAISFLYFAWPWVKSGQTLGMKAWRIALQSMDGGKVTWRQAALRFFAALLSWLPLGLGFLWSLWDREGLAWHDRLSGTRLVLLG
ncbi:MAG: RDD family protein [Gammaproteobacteria bacterium]|nr:MAG: RDD family protein [Gammaproteobacteria bacterium]